MRWNPDNKDSDVNCGNSRGSSPFQTLHCTAVLSNDSNPVDNHLHEELDLKDPEEQDKEENKYAAFMLNSQSDNCGG